MCVQSTEFRLYVILFLPAIVAFAASYCNVTGNNKTQRENITAVENTQAYFSYELQSKSEKFRIDVGVCQHAILRTFCVCRWFSINSPTCTNGSKDVTCEADNTGMRMSLFVSRTDSDVVWMILEHSSSPVVLKHTQLQVTYPPQITKLCVNGEQVNGTHVIGEKQEISISCNFINGNPPVTIRLLNDTGHTLSLTTNIKGPLTIILGAYHCHDSWPTFRCEAPGSERNRSLNIFVKCPPRLTFMPTQAVELTSVAKGLNIGVRSYTSNITKCLMTKSYPGQTLRDVTYELTGNAPMFNLTVRLAENLWIGHGNWTLHVATEFGEAKLTFEFVNMTAQTDFPPTLQDTQQSVTTVVIIFGCLLCVTASSVGILLLCFVKTRQGAWGRRRRQFLVPASGSRDNTEEQQVRVLNEDRSFQAISHAAAFCSFGTEVVEPSSNPPRADGLIYGELEFSDRTSSNVIIGSLPNTQYAQINFANSVWSS